MAMLILSHHHKKSYFQNFTFIILIMQSYLLVIKTLAYAHS